MPPYRPDSRCTGYCPGSSPSASARPSSCPTLLRDVAQECLGLGDLRVPVADARGEIVGDVTLHEARVPPVPGQSDLVDHLAIDVEGLKALGHQRVDLD